MRPEKPLVVGASLVILASITLSFASTAGRGDEPGRLGRLFRFGGNTPTTPTEEPPVIEDRGPQVVSALPSLESTASPTNQPKLIPQPRISRAVTDADPLVTRITLGRSDNGSEFGMFLQVYADGTVIDSEGVHRVKRDALKEVVSALDQGEIHRGRGHCGGPATDFIEHVQMVVYERSLGRLRANSYSFSGNSQGCDHSIRHLQTVLDNLQMKLSRTASATTQPEPNGSIPSSNGSASSPPPILLNGGPAEGPR